jgi:hypothetical protein
MGTNRLTFLALVLVTVAAVGVGVWYFVRDDYPFQIATGDIRGFSYEGWTAAGQAGLVRASGYITDPPPQLAGWVSAMEKDANNAPLHIVGVMTLVLRDGRSLRLDLDLDVGRGQGRWIEPGGAESVPQGVQLSQAFTWYARGVAAGLAATPRAITPTGAP